MIPRKSRTEQPDPSPTPTPRSTTAPPLQQDLFGSPQQRSLEAENAWLRGRLEHAKAAFRTLREERDALTTQVEALKDRCVDALAERDQARREGDQARRELGSAQDSARHWKAMFALAQTLGHPTSAPPAPTQEPTLKKLLLLAHPDKWSQGQPATALAHELTVTLNSLRAEVLR